MLKINQTIEKEGLQADMILQIHDELIFEVDEAGAESLADRFAEIMESIATLNVPLRTSVNYGKNWGS